MLWFSYVRYLTEGLLHVLQYVLVGTVVDVWKKLLSELMVFLPKQAHPHTCICQSVISFSCG